MENLAQLKTEVLESFPRSSTGFSAKFDRRFPEWVNELARAYPFWFLIIRPGRRYDFITSPVTFSPTTPPRLPSPGSPWIDQGVLVLEPTRTEYPLWAPFEAEEADQSAWWHRAFASKVYYVKLWASDGRFLNDLELRTQDEEAVYRYRYSTGAQPNYFTFYTTEEGSSISVWPPPSQYYYATLEFKLEKPPIYQPAGDANQYNRFLTFAPTLLEHYCLFQMSLWFDEAGMQDNYKRILYGDPKFGLDLAIQQETGLIGDFVRQTRDFNCQGKESLRRFRSLRQMVGRNAQGTQRKYNWGYWR